MFCTALLIRVCSYKPEPMKEKVMATIEQRPAAAIVGNRLKARSLWSDAAHTFVRNFAGMAGLIVILLLIFAAIFAPLIAPYNFTAQNYFAIMQAPSVHHWMGTDELGRDILSRVLMGVRTAVLVAVLVTVLSGLLGILFGSIGALIGGWVDSFVTWFMDALLNIPPLWFAAFVSIATRPGITLLTASLYASTHWSGWKDTVLLDYLVVICCLGFVSWAGIGRIVRGQVLALREKEFIEAARALGASNSWIIRRHLVPNVLGAVIVALSVNFGYAMLFEASLSFLGVGIRPPGASLGQMIADGIGRWRSAPHLVAMPGLVLAIVVLASNFLGDALNDALNPKGRQR